jgi:hypothetical protein
MVEIDEEENEFQIDFDHKDLNIESLNITINSLNGIFKIIRYHEEDELNQTVITLQQFDKSDLFNDSKEIELGQYIQELKKLA